MKPDNYGPDDPVVESRLRSRLEEDANRLKKEPAKASERDSLISLVKGMDKEQKIRGTFIPLLSSLGGMSITR